MKKARLVRRASDFSIPLTTAPNRRLMRPARLNAPRSGTGWSVEPVGSSTMLTSRSIHTQASGCRGLPVAIHTQVIAGAFRAKGVFSKTCRFIAPPFAVEPGWVPVRGGASLHRDSWNLCLKPRSLTVESSVCEQGEQARAGRAGQDIYSILTEPQSPTTR